MLAVLHLIFSSKDPRRNSDNPLIHSDTFTQPSLSLSKPRNTGEKESHNIIILCAESTLVLLTFKILGKLQNQVVQLPHLTKENIYLNVKIFSSYFGNKEQLGI